MILRVGNFKVTPTDYRRVGNKSRENTMELILRALTSLQQEVRRIAEQVEYARQLPLDGGVAAVLATHMIHTADVIALSRALQTDPSLVPLASTGRMDITLLLRRALHLATFFRKKMPDQSPNLSMLATYWRLCTTVFKWTGFMLSTQPTSADANSAQAAAAIDSTYETRDTMQIVTTMAFVLLMDRGQIVFQSADTLALTFAVSDELYALIPNLLIKLCTKLRSHFENSRRCTVKGLTTIYLELGARFEKRRSLVGQAVRLPKLQDQTGAAAATDSDAPAEVVTAAGALLSFAVAPCREAKEAPLLELEAPSTIDKSVASIVLHMWLIDNFLARIATNLEGSLAVYTSYVQQFDLSEQVRARLPESHPDVAPIVQRSLCTNRPSQLWEACVSTRYQYAQRQLCSVGHRVLGRVAIFVFLRTIATEFSQTHICLPASTALATSLNLSNSLVQIRHKVGQHFPHDALVLKFRGASSGADSAATTVLVGRRSRAELEQVEEDVA